MKITMKIFLVLAIVALASMAADAAVYNDGDNQFFVNGKVQPLGGALLASYYSSGRIASEHSISLIITYYYLDESFGGTNKGRVFRITTGNHGPDYTFEYWGDTAVVKKAVVYSAYNLNTRESYFDKNGLIQKQVTYNRFGSVDYLSSKMNYSYQYYKGTSRVRRATRDTEAYSSYDPANRAMVIWREHNERDYRSDGTLKTETNDTYRYVNVSGQARLQYHEMSADHYRENGARRYSLVVLMEYSPATGRLINITVTRTFYDENGNVINRNSHTLNTATDGMVQKLLSQTEIADIPQASQKHGTDYVFTGEMATSNSYLNQNSVKK